MGKYPWLILSTAIFLGGFAAFLATRYIHTRIDTAEAAINKAQGKKIQVVVVKADQPRGTRIQRESLATREIAETFVNADMITPDKYEDVITQRLTLPMHAGQPLQWSYLESGQSPAFSGHIPAGSRALTFQVDEINSIAGMIVPGDKIDLMATLKQNGSSVTLPLLQNVIVLATGQTAIRSDPNNGVNLAKQTFSTLTLQLSLLDAGKVIVAQESGKLTALLRHPDDEGKTDMGALDISRIAGSGPERISRNAPSVINRPVAAIKTTERRRVEIIYGGKGEIRQASHDVPKERETEVIHARKVKVESNRELAADIAREMAIQMDEPAPPAVVGASDSRREER